MNNESLDKVFLKNSIFKVTNTSLTYVTKSNWRPKWDVTQTWKAKDVESVEEIVPRNFSVRRLYFWLSVLGFVSFGGQIFNFGELNIFGMSTGFSATVVIMAFTAAFTAIHQKIIKPARYLSIKLKNGKETVINTPFDSLIEVENAWSEAVLFGGSNNNSEWEVSKLRGLEITNNSFSVVSENEPLYITDSGRASKWSSFNVSNIIGIVEPKMSKTWFNQYGIVASIVGGFLSAIYFKSFGSGDLLAMSLFTLVLSGILFAVKRLIELEDMNLTVELKDGEKVKVPGNYSWAGISEAKIALNTAMGRI